MLVVHPSVPVKSVKELIAHARANPGKLTFGSSGVGFADHLAGELFNTLAGVTERLAGLGIFPFTAPTSAEFGGYIKSEIAKYRNVVESAGIKAE